MIIIKVLIIRSHASIVNRGNYNLQEEGLAKALVKKGHVCDIVYYNAKNNFRKEIVNFEDNLSFKIYWLKAKKILTSAVFNKKQLDNIIKEYDIIQVLDYEQLTSLYILKKYSNKTILYHGPYYSEYSKKYCMFSKLFDMLYGKETINNIKAITKSYLAEDFLRSKGIKYTKTIGVGLDIKKFKLENKNKVLHKNKVFNLLYIGQLEERRNIKFIIDLVYELKNKGIDNEIKIIGNGKKSYIDSCKKYAIKLGVEKNIKFCGKVKQKDLCYYYDNCDVFILPTKYEIFGMVLLEAMAFKCIVVTSNNGGSQLVIKDKVNGFIIEKFNISDWVKVLNEIYNNDLTKMKIDASNTIYEKYNWYTLSEYFIEIYNDIYSRNLEG